jgi:hypothetical protein
VPWLPIVIVAGLTRGTGWEEGADMRSSVLPPRLPDAPGMALSWTEADRLTLPWYPLMLDKRTVEVALVPTGETIIGGSLVTARSVT